jgi:hypothetical protein
MELGTSPFARLALTYGLGLAGDVFLTIALSGSLFFTVSASAARPRVLLYLLLTMAPFSVIASVLGPVLDRMRGGRRLVFAFTCAGRAVLCVLMARELNGLLLYPLAFGVLVLAKAQAVSKAALVPGIVDDPRELVGTNSRLALVGVIGGLLAGLPAAAVLKLADAAWVLRVGAIVYLAAFLASLRVSAPPRGTAVAKRDEKAELHQGPVLLAATAMAVLRGGVGFITFLLAFALKRAHEPSWVYGAALAASAVGGLVGNLAAPPARKRVREEAILLVALLVPAAVGVFAARGHGRASSIAAAAAVAFGAAAGRLAFDSIVQRDAPAAAQGRAFARFETRFQLTWVAGALLPVIVPFNLRVGLLVLTLALGFSGLSYLGGLRALRSRRRVAAAAGDAAPAP